MMKNTAASSPLVEAYACTVPQRGTPSQINKQIKNAFLVLTCQHRKRIARIVEQVLSALMFHESEPVISECRDRSGESYYRVYNPLDGRIHYFTSENEVRIWLERRYYA